MKIIAIIRDGMMRCTDCIYDSVEHAILHDSGDALCLMEEHNIQVLTDESPLKGTEKCSKCGGKIEVKK